MTKDERRAEKIRMLVLSGSLYAEAARVLRDSGVGLGNDTALICVLTAEITRALKAPERSK